MNMLGPKLVTPDEVRSEVVDFCGGEDMAPTRTRGYYLSLIRKALTELSFDTMFDRKNFDAEVPDNLIVALPEDYAGIFDVYLFNGPVCDISTAQNVYWHKNMMRHGAGSYLANNREAMEDALMETSMSQVDNELYYFNIREGNLMLSSSCLQYESVYVSYSGMGSDFAQEPLVPLYAKQAVVDYCTMETLRAASARDPGRWAGMYADAQRRCLGGGNPAAGSWHQAKVRIARETPKQAKDSAKYRSWPGTPGR